MKKILLLCLLPAAALAQSEGRTQYITDQVTATMREAPRMDAPAKLNLRSGVKIVVLQTLGPDSFARVRLEDGREGWIPARYISSEPAAKDKLAPVQAELAQSRERVKALERELAQAKDTIAKAAPALQLAEDNEKLKAQVAEAEKAGEELKRRYSDEEAKRKTLITGAVLVGAGVLAGLILPLLRGGGRRRGGF